LLVDSLANYFFEDVVVSTREGLRQLCIVVGDVALCVLVCQPYFFDSLRLSFDLLILLVVERLVVHLVEGQLWLTANLLVHLCEVPIQ
jgi:hypothetical protein